MGDKFRNWLKEKRENMLQRAKLELIDKLHQLGRQLGVLKRIYKTYEITVNQLLLHQQRMLRDGARSNGSSAALPLFADDDPEMMPLTDTAGTATIGVRLSPSAIVRFERLADRIRLYALGEIEDCLIEKETLTFLVYLSSSYSVRFPGECLVTNGSLELQPYRPEGLPSCRKAYSNHDPSREGDDIILAREFDDGIFLNWDTGTADCLHGENVLDLLCGYHGVVDYRALDLWRCERHHRRQDHLPFSPGDFLRCIESSHRERKEEGAQEEGASGVRGGLIPHTFLDLVCIFWYLHGRIPNLQSTTFFFWRYSFFLPRRK